MPLIAPLPYYADSSLLFAVIAYKPWAVFLDSSNPHCKQGRYDILAAEPVCTLVTHGKTTVITRDNTSTQSTENPFDLVKQQLLPAYPDVDELPFNGGAIGYFSYDLARQLEDIPEIAEDTESIAEMAIGIYNWAIIIDHQLQKSTLIAQELDNNQFQLLIDRFTTLESTATADFFTLSSGIEHNMDKAFYAKAFEQIMHYLREGDCYQVNLSQRFSARCEGNPWIAYLKLREINAAPFSCFLNFPEARILSSSPERFLKLSHGIVETKPIKGTRPRKQNLDEDQQQITQLAGSHKDKAENLMIVDLLRNDISKTCSNVKVPVLFAIESYTTLHHLVSTVTGELKQQFHALDLLKSCFPGGSITGAPKIRAIEIIEELEPNRRGVYCGAIGYIGFNGNMDTNIAIRTLVHSQNTMRFWAGGGIVYDSVMEDEYQESFDKAAALIELLKLFS